MSQPNTIAPFSAAAAQPRGDVRGAIARAAQATGIDFTYLLGQAKIESSLDPGARADTSSAAGLFQFTGSTWLTMLGRHGAEHGLGWAQAAIAGGDLGNPAIKSQIMALRFDPQASAAMAAELAGENRTALQGVLGREPDPAELYMAHFLGAEGAGRFLTALASDPEASAASLLPRAAAANRAIFFTPGGAPRSLGEVMGLLRGRMNAAMEGAGELPSTQQWGFEPPAWAAGASQAAAAPPQPPERPSMAQTLAATFGGSNEAMPAHVRAAYGKLKAFGL